MSMGEVEVLEIPKKQTSNTKSFMDSELVSVDYAMPIMLCTDLFIRVQ